MGTKQERKNTRKSNHLYVMGNVAPKINHPYEHQKDITIYIDKRREHKTNWIGYIGMACALACVFFFCVQHLKLQSEISKTIYSINQKEEAYRELKEENDDDYRRLSTDYDIDEIKEIAMNELGMVYPDEGQIVYYEGGEVDYVKQFAEIPEK